MKKFIAFFCTSSPGPAPSGNLPSGVVYQRPPFWISLPFLRFLPPLVAGIATQWYRGLDSTFLMAGLCGSAGWLLAYGYWPLHWRWRLAAVNGLAAYSLLF